MSALLCDLDTHRVTAEQLEATDTVKVLYRVLKSCRDESVKKRLKGLLGKWKKEYSQERCEKNDVKTRSETEQEAEDVSKAGADVSPVRSKCVQLLVSAISLEPKDHAQASALATDVENHIHDLHKSNPSRYKTCVRSKIANLKNPKSRHLREGLLNGSLSPQTFAAMTAEEMASPDLQRLRREYSSRGVSERQLPQSVEGTPTEKVRCRRCGRAECTVRQVNRGTLFLPAWVRQSGPDDDAMTFVTCASCGQQWYHNNWVTL